MNISDVITQDVIIQSVQTFFATKNMLGDSILRAVPDVYTLGFTMIFTGNIVQIMTGLLMNFGLTVMIFRGLWKLLASSLAHQIFGFIFNACFRFLIYQKR